MRPRIRRLALALWLLPLVPAGAHAQRVAGTVQTGEGVPLGGVLVSVRDSAGVEQARAISTASGGFDLPALRGAFRLSVARIGFRRWDSEPMRVAGVETRRVTLTVEHLPQLLPELVASTDLTCGALPDARAAVLWDDAQTALAAVDATLQGERLAYRTRAAYRRLDAAEYLVWDTLRIVVSEGRWPVEAVAPDSLFGHGFVQPRGDPDDLSWYGPDLDVLFDPRFLERYCLRAVEGPEGSGLMGVQFRPAERWKHWKTDIEGILWLDARTRELGSLEFFYVRMASWIPEGTAGGQLEFVPVGDGRWLIERWRMRAPRPHRGNMGTRLNDYLEWDVSVEVALTASRDTVWRSDLPLSAAPIGDTSARRPSGPFRVSHRKHKDGSLEVRVRNVSDQPQVLERLVMRRCVNVLAPCVDHMIGRTVGSGEEMVAAILRPWLPKRPMRAEFTAVSPARGAPDT
jgi:hypothetical protein